MEVTQPTTALYMNLTSTISTERRPSVASYHRILSFHENPNKYLISLKKGSKVYVEAGFEIREPEPGADASTPQGQRQIFLRHGPSSNLPGCCSTEILGI